MGKLEEREMKIENFQTSVVSDPNLKPVNLDPKENIKNQSRK